MSELYLIYLFIVETVFFERIFSKSGLIISKNRIAIKNFNRTAALLFRYKTYENTNTKRNTELVHSSVQWKYFINLVGRDFPLRTNEKMLNSIDT